MLDSGKNFIVTAISFDTPTLPTDVFFNCTGEETFLGDASYRYLTTEEMKSLGDDSIIPGSEKDQMPDSPMIVKEHRAGQVEATPTKMDLEKQREAEYNRYNQQVSVCSE